MIVRIGDSYIDTDSLIGVSQYVVKSSGRCVTIRAHQIDASRFLTITFMGFVELVGRFFGVEVNRVYKGKVTLCGDSEALKSVGRAVEELASLIRTRGIRRERRLANPYVVDACLTRFNSITPCAWASEVLPLPEVEANGGRRVTVYEVGESWTRKLLPLYTRLIDVVARVEQTP